MENFIRVNSEKLTQFIHALLITEGVDVEEAKIISEVLVWSDLIGRSTHGVNRPIRSSLHVNLNSNKNQKPFI